MLCWDALWTLAGNTRVVNEHTVVQESGKCYIVRAEESITCESGPMTWEIQIGESSRVASVLVGVISCDWDDCTDFENANMWVMGWNAWEPPCWNGAAWTNAGVGVKEIICDEDANDYIPEQGDILRITFAPSQHLLSVSIPNCGFVTTRKLVGRGLHEVHPCILLPYSRTSARVASRVGTSKNESTKLKKLKIEKKYLQYREDIMEQEKSAWKFMRCLCDCGETKIENIALKMQIDRVSGLVLGGIAQAFVAIQQKLEKMEKQNEAIQQIQCKNADTCREELQAN